MNAVQQLLTDHIDMWTAADTGKKSGRGRASSNASSVYGVRKLRELILELAVRGKLVPQDTTEKPASELLKRIHAEKAKLITEGKIKNDKPLPPITEEEKPFELAHGWEWIRLNELLRKIGAGSTPLGGKQVYLNEGIPFLRSQNVWDEGLRLDDVAFISPETHLKMSGTHICAGDLLFNITGASIGRCAIVPESFGTGNVSQHVTIVRSVSKELLQFLHLVLISRHVQQTVMDVQVGVSREGLSIGKLGQFIIPIPPLTEQHRIVAKVDELMALCDQLETQHTNATEAHDKLVSHLLGTLTQSQSAEDFSANWQRIATHFDTLFTSEASIDALKQTLLQLAVMGKLVPQDPKDEPASELLKCIQAEKAKLIAEGKIKKDKTLPQISDEQKPFDLPQGWEWVRFAEISTIKGELVRSEYFQDCRQVAPDCIEKGTGRLTEFRTVKESGIRGPNSRFYKGQIVYSKIRPSLSKAVLVDFDGLCSADMYPIDAFIDPEFLLKQILSEFFLEQVRIAENRIKMPKLNQESLTAFVLPLPPLSEQVRIVAKLNKLVALSDQLKVRIREANQLQQKLADVMVQKAVV